MWKEALVLDFKMVVLVFGVVLLGCVGQNTPNNKDSLASNSGSYEDPVQGTNNHGAYIFGAGSTSSYEILRKQESDDEVILGKKVLTLFPQEYRAQLKETLDKEWSKETVDVLVGMLLENTPLDGEIKINTSQWRVVVNLLAYMSSKERGLPLSEHIVDAYDQLFARALELDNMKSAIKYSFKGNTWRAIRDYGSFYVLTESYWNNVQNYGLQLGILKRVGDKTTIEKLKTIRDEEWAKSSKKKINETIALLEMHLQYPELRDLPSENALDLGERLYEIEEQRISAIRRRTQGKVREDISKALTAIADRLSEESQGVEDALLDLGLREKRDLEFRVRNRLPLTGPYFPSADNAKPSEVSKDL